MVDLSLAIPSSPRCLASHPTILDRFLRGVGIVLTHPSPNDSDEESTEPQIVFHPANCQEYLKIMEYLLTMLVKGSCKYKSFKFRGTSYNFVDCKAPRGCAGDARPRGSSSPSPARPHISQPVASRAPASFAGWEGKKGLLCSLTILLNWEEQRKASWHLHQGHLLSISSCLYILIHCFYTKHRLRISTITIISQQRDRTNYIHWKLFIWFHWVSIRFAFLGCQCNRPPQ